MLYFSLFTYLSWMYGIFDRDLPRASVRILTPNISHDYRRHC